jgi:hypothetical protein
MKYDQDHFQESPRLPPEELCVAKSFSLKRALIAAIRTRAAHLGISMSRYLSILVCQDLAKGLDSPLSLGGSGTQMPTKVEPSPGRGVVVELDLED